MSADQLPILQFILHLLRIPDDKIKVFQYNKDREAIQHMEKVLKISDIRQFSKDGFCLSTPKSYVIAYDETRPQDEIIFTFCHETAHCFLGHVTEQLPQNAEWEADMLASMLMYLITKAAPIMKRYAYAERKELKK